MGSIPIISTKKKNHPRVVFLFGQDRWTLVIIRKNIVLAEQGAGDEPARYSFELAKQGRGSIPIIRGVLGHPRVVFLFGQDRWTLVIIRKNIVLAEQGAGDEPARYSF